MRRFARNIFRLSLKNKGSFLGAVFIIAIGIFCQVSMTDTLKNLSGQVDAYYADAALADIFAEVSGISEAELRRLEELPGIRAASGKLAADIRLLADGQEEIVTVHLLSYEETDAVNQLSLSSPFPSDDSLYLGTRMAETYGYESGEPLRLLYGGSSSDFVFSGTVSAPDYIYSIPPGGAMIPDGEVYDIACVKKSKLEELLGRRGTVNELGFALSPGYTYDDVKSALAAELEPYGLLSMTDRDGQTSYDMVSGEMDELISMGTILPVLFLAISVFMLYVVLKKMIDRDQSLIGTMKAFGLTDAELMGAYLAEGAAAGIAGAVLGSILAIPFGSYMFGMYVKFFNLPDPVYHSYLLPRLEGLLLAAATGCGAVFLGVREILAITPAQAMRARAPRTVRALPLPAMFAGRLGPMERLGLRSMARSPFRGFLIALAVGFPFAMSSVLFSFGPAARAMFVDQFVKVQVYDFQLSLDGYVSPVAAAESAMLLPGVTESEGVCIRSAELVHENRREFAVAYGLHPGSSLWKVMDLYGTGYALPERGIIINSRYADKLHVKAGDEIRISLPGLSVGEVTLPVTAVIAESIGNGCYLSIDSFPKLFQTAPAANTVLLRTEPGQREAVKEKLLTTSRVSYLVDTDKIVESYQDMMDSMILMVNLFAAFSVAAGGILIYQISMINLRDRITELGTLMVLGKTEREIGRLLLFEHMTYFACGIVLGLPGSIGIKWLVERIVVSDSYTMDITMSPWACLAAFAVCLGIALAAYRAELAFTGKIRLTEILKERE